MKPNPGTEEAIKAGCTCSIIDNHYGKGIERPDGTVYFWYTEHCPIHGFKVENITKGEENG